MSSRKQVDKLSLKSANDKLLYQCVQICCDLNVTDLSGKEKQCLKNCKAKTEAVHKLYGPAIKKVNTAYPH